MKSSPQRTWSLELVIVIALPLLTVVAGVATMVIASESGFNQDTSVQLDRFAQPPREP